MNDEWKRKALFTGLSLAAFFAAGPISRKLRRTFPNYPFASQVLVGGSIAVAAYSIAKALYPKSEAPEAMLSKAWGVFGGAYNSMKASEEVGED